NLSERVKENFNALIQLQMESSTLLAEPIARSAELVVQRLLEGGKILSCGNGGAAGNAQHFCTLMINRYQRERPGLPALSLSNDTATLTSIAGDYDYDEVFAKQVRTLGHPGDILLAFSNSGNSENVNAAIQAAHERDMPVIALNGRDGGRLAGMLQPNDIELRVTSDDNARIQEIHLLTIHCLCDLIDRQLLGG
ncbi:MAG: phosphoheptose isomerase, partial [Candidatus Sedimenticola sp. (ex Thyasira tokunagai)]